MMSLCVQFPEVTVQVQVSESDVVSDLKKRMTFFSEAQDLLTFNGCMLADDDALLTSLGIKDGSTVSVIAKNGCLITRRRSAIASALYAIGAGCKSILSGFGLTLPSVVKSFGLVASASIIGSGLVIAARIYADQKQTLPSKDEIKEIAREITDHAMQTLSVNNYTGAKEVFREMMRNVYTVGSRMYRLMMVRE